jgi:FkbM family methyltransferase
MKLSRLATRPEHWRALREGVVASVEHADVPFRADVRTVLDVGASRGQFALFALSRFPQAAIRSFEPLPGARDKLKVVTAGRVEIVAAAVGAEPGRAELNVSAQDDSSSLLPIGRRQVAEYPGTEATTTIEVDVVTLASVLSEALPGPVLLKIDVQGFELDVLRGAGELLSKVDEVFVECSFVELYDGQALADEVVAFLFEHDLRLAGVYGLSHTATGEALQADLLFRR